MVLTAVFALMQRMVGVFQPVDRHEQLTAVFPAGSNTNERNSGTFATKNITNAEKIMCVEPMDLLPNDNTKKEDFYQQLLLIIDSALEKYRTTLTPGP